MWCETWVAKACELAEQYQVDISSNVQNFKKYYKMTASNCYKHSWLLEVMNINRNLILRTYAMSKTEFGSEKWYHEMLCHKWREDKTVKSLS